MPIKMVCSRLYRPYGFIEAEAKLDTGHKPYACVSCKEKTIVMHTEKEKTIVAKEIQNPCGA